VIAAFATPLTILAGFVIFCLIFRPQIASWVDRLGQIKIWGAAVEATGKQIARQERDVQSLPSTERVIAAEVSGGIADSPHLAQRRTLIAQALDKHNLQGLEREKFLIRSVALLGSAWDHESTYRLIFGSQLRFLSELAARPFTRQETEAFFLQATEPQPVLKGTPVDRWLSFLEGRELITHDSEGSYVITDKGRDLLKYMIDGALPFAKPL
jgi:hypothetical protein